MNALTVLEGRLQARQRPELEGIAQALGRVGRQTDQSAAHRLIVGRLAPRPRLILQAGQALRVEALDPHPAGALGVVSSSLSRRRGRQPRVVQHSLDDLGALHASGGFGSRLGEPSHLALLAPPRSVRAVAACGASLPLLSIGVERKYITIYLTREPLSSLPLPGEIDFHPCLVSGCSPHDVQTAIGVGRTLTNPTNWPPEPIPCPGLSGPRRVARSRRWDRRARGCRAERRGTGDGWWWVGGRAWRHGP